MPGPVVAKPEIPWWMDPAKASVTDVPGQGLLRKVVGLLGLDDPNQVMALGIPIETGAAGGGMLEAVAQKFPRLAKAIKAYHGSPHDFERFDSSKIGTGEGAQAYGPGLYFAEQEGTAQTYKMTPQGKMYEVAIKADPDDFLDWDKPLSQQSEKVKQGLAERGIQADAVTGETAYQKLTGSQVTNPMLAHLTRGPQKAADALKQVGIPGIKYLDQGSRAAGEGSRNYVVFDDKLVEILKKYGIAAPMIEGLRQTASANQGRVSQQQIEAVTQ